MFQFLIQVHKKTDNCLTVGSPRPFNGLWSKSPRMEVKYQIAKLWRDFSSLKSYLWVKVVQNCLGSGHIKVEDPKSSEIVLKWEGL